LSCEWFLKVQDVHWICWIRKWKSKLKMLARHL